MSSGGRVWTAARTHVEQNAVQQTRDEARNDDRSCDLAHCPLKERGLGRCLGGCLRVHRWVGHCCGHGERTRGRRGVGERKREEEKKRESPARQPWASEPLGQFSEMIDTRSGCRDDCLEVLEPLNREVRANQRRRGRYSATPLSMRRWRRAAVVSARSSKLERKRNERHAGTAHPSPPRRLLRRRGRWLKGRGPRLSSALAEPARSVCRVYSHQD